MGATPTAGRVRRTARTPFAQALRQRYEQGEDLEDIAAELAASHTYVYVLLVESGARMRFTPVAPLGSEERAALARMMREGYDAGLSQPAVARSIGCDHDTARTLITEAGGTIRSAVVSGLPEHARSMLAQRLRIEYEHGAGLEQLSADLGCRHSSVRCLLVEAGATIRAPGGAPIATTQPPSSGQQMSLRELASLVRVPPSRPRAAACPVTTEDAPRLVECYRAGETIAGLATSTGYTYTAVRNSLLASGVTLRPKAIPHASDEQIADVVRRYRAGERISVLASSTGLSYGQVTRMVRRNQVSPAKGGDDMTAPDDEIPDAEPLSAEDLAANDKLDASLRELD